MSAEAVSGALVGTAESPAVEAPAYQEAPPARVTPPRPPQAFGRGRTTAVRTSRVVVRRVDAWSVLKLSIFFYLSVCIVLLVAGMLLWSAASSAGVIDNIESFMVEIGFDDFRFLPGQILRGAALAGLVLVVAGTFANVLLATLYNLIGDVIGGIKLTLAEDESNRPRL